MLINADTSFCVAILYQMDNDILLYYNIVNYITTNKMYRETCNKFIFEMCVCMTYIVYLTT